MLLKFEKTANNLPSKLKSFFTVSTHINMTFIDLCQKYDNCRLVTKVTRLKFPNLIFCSFVLIIFFVFFMFSYKIILFFTASKEKNLEARKSQ